MLKRAAICFTVWAAVSIPCTAQKFYNWESEPELLNVSGGITFYSMISVGATSEWANSITITIDSSKVDANLTNFPLLLNLGESSGIGNTNLAAFFTELGANSNKLSVQGAGGNE